MTPRNHGTVFRAHRPKRRGAYYVSPVEGGIATLPGFVESLKLLLKYIVFSGRALTGDELLAALSSYEKRAIERGES